MIIKIIFSWYNTSYTRIVLYFRFPIWDGNFFLEICFKNESIELQRVIINVKSSKLISMSQLFFSFLFFF